MEDDFYDDDTSVQHPPAKLKFYVSVSSGDDFFGDEFNDEFDAMEESDRFHDKLEDGFKNWEERHASTKNLLLECFDL